MTTRFDIEQADFQFEAIFEQPQFSLLEKTGNLLGLVFRILQPSGARLSDIRIDQGGGSAAEMSVVCQLYTVGNITVRVKIDRVEATGIQLQRQQIEKFSGAIVDTVKSLSSFEGGITFRSYALAVAMHGYLEDGKSPKDYVSNFITKVPEGLGPSAGSGLVMYFGPHENRLLCSITIDLSAVVPNGLFVRPHVLWDGTKIEAGTLPSTAESFLLSALDKIDLAVPK